MKDIANKTDNVDELPANGFNSIVDELENTVTDSGQTLDASSETTPDPSPTQLSRAITEASQSADFYTDSGAADAYVLTAAGNWRQSTAYRNGQHFRFLPTNANTGASTINVSGLGVKTLENVNGTSLNANQLDTTRVALVYYDSSADKFKLIDPTFGQDAGGAVASYITNFGAEAGTEGWATYADAAAATPVDGTGGSPTVTWSRITDFPLVGTGSFLFTKDAVNRQGEGVSYNFVLPVGYRNQNQSLSLIFEVATGTYTDGDIAVFLYDVDGATLITPEVSSLSDQVNANLIQTKFTLDDANSANYRFIIHQASTTTNGYTIRFDQFIVINSTDPQDQVTGVNLNENPNGALPLNRNTTNDIGSYIDSGAGVAGSVTYTASEIPLYPYRLQAIKLTLASGTNDYTGYRFSVPSAYRNRFLRLRWDQLVSGLSIGDMKLELYRYSDAYVTGEEEVIFQITDNSSGDTEIQPLKEFKTSFAANEYEYYELRWINNGGTSGYISMNEISIDIGDTRVNSIEYYGGAYTPTPSGGGSATYTSNNAEWWRKGEWLKIIGRVRIGTAGSGTSTFSLELPPGLTINSNKLPGALFNFDNQMGEATLIIGGTTGEALTQVLPITSTTFGFLDVGSATVIQGADLAGSTIIGYKLEIPILEWANSDTLTLTGATHQNARVSAYRNTSVQALTGSTYNNIAWNAIETSLTTQGISLNVSTGNFTPETTMFVDIHFSLSLGSSVSWLAALRQSTTVLRTVESSVSENRAKGTISYKLTGGVEYNLALNPSSGVNVNNSQTTSWIDIKRDSDKSDQLTNVPTSDGVASYKQHVAIDYRQPSGGFVALDNNFTTGNLYISRIGNVVTITEDASPAHASNANPASSTGLIPVGFRPISEVEQQYAYESSGASMIVVKTDGTWTHEYYDTAGASTARGNSGGHIGSISYITGDA